MFSAGLGPVGSAGASNRLALADDLDDEYLPKQPKAPNVRPLHGWGTWTAGH